MKQLTRRQLDVYNYIRRNQGASNRDIKAFLESKGESISRITIVRELDFLIDQELITKEGAGRSVEYRVNEQSDLLHYLDADSYFETDIDNRDILETFNFAVFESFGPLFSESEHHHLNSLTQKYKHNIKQLSEELHQKEIERLTIELSWKSSQIEGNTYTLLDTEALIKEKRLAPGTSDDEARMILNHKTAIDYVLSDAVDYQTLSVRKIEDIHRLLIDGLGVSHGLRQGLVRITGTNFKPLDNPHQIKESLEKMVNVVNTYTDVFHKTIASIVLVSYIQPFMDGNKRTARLLGNAILNSMGACPLSYRSVDPVDYKKAILLFYEQNSMSNFKELFISQYEFSVNHYFL